MLLPCKECSVHFCYVLQLQSICLCVMIPKDIAYTYMCAPGTVLTLGSGLLLLCDKVYVAHLPNDVQLASRLVCVQCNFHR